MKKPRLSGYKWPAKVPCWPRVALMVKSGEYDSYRPCSAPNVPYHPWEIQGWWRAGSIPLLCSCRNPQSTHRLAREKAVPPPPPRLCGCVVQPCVSPVWSRGAWDQKEAPRCALSCFTWPEEGVEARSAGHIPRDQMEGRHGLDRL